MNPVRLSLVVLTLLLIPASLALAGGFQLNEVGARAMGMGGAFTAKANDLTAMYFNPAGLAYQKGFGAYLGGTMILPSNSYTTPSGSSTTEMVSQTFLLPNGYVGYGMENGLAFGLGVFVPYGLGTEWPAGWVGRTEAMKSDIQVIMINPTVAYRLSDQFMIGGGVSWATSTVKLSYDIPTGPGSYGSVALEADGNAFSFDLGAIYKPIPKLSVGVSYRHTTDLDLEGTAVFSNMGSLAPLFPGGTGKTNIVLPNTIFAGVAYDVNENLTLAFDYHWVGWSTYDSLNLELPYGPVYPPAGRPLQGPSRSEKAWKDTYLLRVGGEYRHNEWSFRLGFVYDANPQPAKYVEPTLPDANRVEGTLGVGYKFSKNWFVDAAFQFISFSDRTVTGPPPTGDQNDFPGTYKASANLIGLSIGYSM